MQNGDKWPTSFLVDRHLQMIDIYVRKIHDILFTDLNLHPNKVNLVFLVKDLRSQVGFQYMFGYTKV